MVDPINLINVGQSILGLLLKINTAVGKFSSNKKECARLCRLMGTVRTVVEEGLKRTPDIMEDKVMSQALLSLDDALKRSWKVVGDCQGMSILRQAAYFKDIAEKLTKVHDEIFDNLVVVLVANSCYHNSTFQDIKKALADLLDKVDHNSMLVEILGIIATHPDAHLRRQVKRLVHDSTKYANDKNKKKMETKKIEVAIRPEVKIERKTIPADSRVSRSSLSDGSVKSTSVLLKKKSTSVKPVSGQSGLSIVNKDSSHSCNPSEISGPSKKDKNKINKVDGTSAGPEVKSEKNNLPAGTTESRASLSHAKSTSLKSVNGQGRPGTAIKIMSRPTKNLTLVQSIDVHPDKTWIVTGHEGGNVSIWDYKKQKIVMELQVKEMPGKTSRLIHDCSQVIKETSASHWVCSVKFIVREEWLVVGDGGGYIHVCAYTDAKLRKVKLFSAYGHGKAVSSLAVHPTSTKSTYLLSSSLYDNEIKLWDWSQNWKRIYKFNVNPTNAYFDGVRSLMFNPRDSNTFACVTDEGKVQVGSIKPSYSLTTKLNGPIFDAHLYSNHNYMVTLRSKSSDNAEIWDLKKEKVVRSLHVKGRQMMLVSGHPTLPILVTVLDDGTVRFWDATTYKLQKTVPIMDNKKPVQVFPLLTDTINDKIRLVVTFESKIVIMEDNLPVTNTSPQSGSGGNR